MRFQFTEAEKNYIHPRLQALANMLTRYKLPSGSEKILFKMRGKFAPNSKITFLGQKERALLMVILQRLMNDYISQNSISPDMDVVQGLIDKVQL